MAVEIGILIVEIEIELPQEMTCIGIVTLEATTVVAPTVMTIAAMITLW